MAFVNVAAPSVPGPKNAIINPMKVKKTQGKRDCHFHPLFQATTVKIIITIDKIITLNLNCFNF